MTKPQHLATNLATLATLLTAALACVAALCWLMLCAPAAGQPVPGCTCSALAVAALPVRGRLRALLRRLQAALLCWQARETQRQIQQIRTLQRHDARRLAQLQARQARQQRQLLDVRSRP